MSKSSQNPEDDPNVCSTVPEDVHQHANANWKAFRRWYHTEYTKVPGVVISKQAALGMQRLLVGQDWHHAVSRAELCNDTIAILEAWPAVPLVPGTKEYRFARARMIRDIIYEKLAAFNGPQAQGFSPLSLMHQLLPADPTLAVLNLTKGEISVAYRWIYQTGSREFAKYRAYRQPFSYPVLARDGVTTLPARFSQDNDHLYGGSRVAPLPSMRAPLAPMPVNKSITANERFHPYARPRTMANPLSPPTVKEPPLALLVEDPSVPTPIEDPSLPTLFEDPSFQTLVMDKPSETSPSNEMTLDELVQEAKDQQAIIGYTEASVSQKTKCYASLSQHLLNLSKRQKTWCC
ncbi:MAG: hypothetical protein L6R42_006692 [Xanthoria sp. 1 TBL-2021]|nr:MAG: hypothetical protein L6R42_006692 [Xanthoria sp. 1 TBL-2021]